MYDKMNVVRLGWDDYAQKNQGDRHLSEEIFYLSKFEGLLKNNSHILDAGCGTGKPVIGYFLNKNHSVTGVDISKKQLEKAKLNFPQVNFIEGNILEVPQAKFDAIICLHSIEYIQREYHQPLLEKFNSMLNPDGKILLTCPLGSKDAVQSFIEDVQMYYSYFNQELFSEIIAAARLNVLYSKVNDNQTYYILNKPSLNRGMASSSKQHKILFSS